MNFIQRIAVRLFEDIRQLYRQYVFKCIYMKSPSFASYLPSSVWVEAMITPHVPVVMIILMIPGELVFPYERIEGRPVTESCPDDG